MSATVKAINAGNYGIYPPFALTPRTPPTAQGARICYCRSYHDNGAYTDSLRVKALASSLSLSRSASSCGVSLTAPAGSPNPASAPSVKRCRPPCWWNAASFPIPESQPQIQPTRRSLVTFQQPCKCPCSESGNSPPEALSRPPQGRASSCLQDTPPTARHCFQNEFQCLAVCLAVL